ncbi:hypothetical protein L1987_20191 [Smallanthus sonchifolius]|uniref:Uncharacterized protein n=1 Tax=Smallanthus sonchifolius TaxID=185202 RepID=A0ACB9ISY6_9ASTR|nr:hypothetical protein L1987_20191 [Smallanthus sonchifolius]
MNKWGFYYHHNHCDYAAFFSFLCCNSNPKVLSVNKAISTVNKAISAVYDFDWILMDSVEAFSMVDHNSLSSSIAKRASVS